MLFYIAQTPSQRSVAYFVRIGLQPTSLASTTETAKAAIQKNGVNNCASCAYLSLSLRYLESAERVALVPPVRLERILLRSRFFLDGAFPPPNARLVHLRRSHKKRHRTIAKRTKCISG